MMTYRIKRQVALILTVLMLILSFSGCGGGIKTSGDPSYEEQVITVEGLADGEKTISVTQLRELAQHKMEGKYKRTTGLEEEHQMEGPTLEDVIKFLGGNLSEYAGIGVQGSDGYYCLLSKEIIQATPDLMVAVIVDGKAKLPDEVAPAWLGVQGQYGPYWVKKVSKIILYKEIPEKKITSVWIFNNLAKGIDPFMYEYYGSKDAAIDLEQIFSRFDTVDSKAFFTMKSADGFKKNEAINMVKSRYYIKVEGVDSPTNISPYIKLGMNVKNISWISTNADAAIFPKQLEKYLEIKEIRGEKGIPLSEILYETEVKKLKAETFDLIGTSGEKITVPGEALTKGILVDKGNQEFSVIWEEPLNYGTVANLMRIKRVEKASQGQTEGLLKEKSSAVTQEQQRTGNKENAVLTIEGNGLDETHYFSQQDLEKMNVGDNTGTYSTLNNWPTQKTVVAEGIDMESLLSQAGMKDSAKHIRVEAKDGFYATFTKEQLIGKRFYFPELKNGSKNNAVLVKSLFAMGYGEESGGSRTIKKTEPRLVIGQVGLKDMNTMASVQKINKIIVSTENPGRWNPVTTSIQPGKVEKGTRVELVYEEMDKVRIYYTLDGKTPSYDSMIYNPSTTYFQPELIKPIEINKALTIKVLVYGYGKYDSEISTFSYTF